MLRRIDWAAADEEEEEEAMATDGAQRPNYCRLVWQVRGSVWGCNADIFRLLFDAIIVMQCTHLKRLAGFSQPSGHSPGALVPQVQDRDREERRGRQGLLAAVQARTLLGTCRSLPGSLGISRMPLRCTARVTLVRAHDRNRSDQGAWHQKIWEV